ncbi:MAG: hypothetical protein GY834_09980, partial [Bacteroidetes bacterium]|nr:hypothetical protein [Bacteroidota bacterium]
LSLKKLLTKLSNIIRQGIITLVTDDSETYPHMQVEYNGKTVYVTRISPYGVCSNPPVDSFALVMNSSGTESIKFGIPIDFINRMKNLIEGEAALFNSKTDTYILMKSDGTITTNADIIIDGISFLDHVHEQDTDSDGDTEQDTDVPKNKVI